MGHSTAAVTPQYFVEKWSRVELSERSASHQHFMDLCRLLGQPAPADHDATGAEYAFEKGVGLTEAASRGAKGDYGFADVWWRDKFAWEYKRKGKYKDLNEAYRQLLVYREALGNPPLLVVSDISRTEIHTNFTGTKKEVHSIELTDLTKPGGLDKLHRVFADPESFKPQITTEKVTQEVAAGVGNLALALLKRCNEPHAVAHFLMKCMFCLFAEDVQLLPNKLFTKLLKRSHSTPEKFKPLARQLFAAMKDGGEFGLDPIPFFNGGLFDDAEPLDLNFSDIGLLRIAAEQDWSAVEPHIFGTLFERSLDPSKRAQIGAHYTGRDDILLVVEPVVMAPLRREWDKVKSDVASLVLKRATIVQKVGLANLSGKEKAGVKKINAEIHRLLTDFQGRLSHVRVLDPACGSGNFLYVALQQLLNLEKEVVALGALPHIGMPLLPRVRPTQLHGIEINPYAAELASVVIWIGYLQWMRDNGFVAPSNPVLEKMTTIENRDAILDLSDPENPASAKWPEADFIIGNPPFLGVRQFRRFGLSDQYIAALFKSYDLPKTVDLCGYWLELARQRMTRVQSTRIGLLATQGIRGRDSRKVLARIVENGFIFNAWSDRDWVLEGAAVHVSIIAFTGVDEEQKHLDGIEVDAISSSLKSGSSSSGPTSLDEMSDLSFQGPVKVGDFDISLDTALQLLTAPRGPTGCSNADVVRPWRNGESINSRYGGDWIIDFAMMEMSEAAEYEAPFEYVRSHVKPSRDKVRREGRRERWWLFGEPNPAMRKALANLPRFIGTCQTAKHRIWTWLDQRELAGQTVIGVARSDDYMLGTLHSAIHELWARHRGSQLREIESGSRYTPTTCFATFPLPWSPRKEDVKHPAYQRIAAAAKELNERRERWLNPPEWMEPLAAPIDAADDFADVPAEARPLVRQSAIMAAASKDPKLKKRTLTNLYNERPTWLRLAHETLDRAVLAAYAATDPGGDWDEDWAAVWTDTGAGQAMAPNHEAYAERQRIDQLVLANLLRLNRQRSATTP